MRVRTAVVVLALAPALAGLIGPGAASADCVHVVAPGESLASIAAADGLSVDQLAAANGLSSIAQLDAGTCLGIPPQSGPAVPAQSGPAQAGPAAALGDGDNDSDDAGDGDGDSDDVGLGSSAAQSTAAPASTPAGSYVVQPGDTLTAIAAREGMSVDQLAADNGLYLNDPLVIGTVLRFSGSAAPASPSQSPAQGPAPTPPSTSSAATSQPVGAAAEGSSVNPPYPTPQSVSPSEVGSIAAANGVPPALADAIAYQESGFNNAAVSSADARGVMQILPGTWDWIQQTLVPGASPLSPTSASDNIRGGVLLLHSLLNATGGNAALAAAGYYQGLPSVQRNGMYPSTQQYVNNVLALEQRFNGG